MPTTKKELSQMTKNNGRHKVVKIGGKEFTLQHPGIRAGGQLRDKSRDKNGQMSEDKLYANYMKHVIIEPAQLNYDTFEQWFDDGEFTPSDFNKLMQAATKFVMGTDTDEVDDEE